MGFTLKWQVSRAAAHVRSQGSAYDAQVWFVRLNGLFLVKVPPMGVAEAERAMFPGHKETAKKLLGYLD